MVVQLSEYTKNYCTLKWVNRTVCELYLDKVIKNNYFFLSQYTFCPINALENLFTNDVYLTFYFTFISVFVHVTYNTLM